MVLIEYFDIDRDTYIAVVNALDDTPKAFDLVNVHKGMNFPRFCQGSSIIN